MLSTICNFIANKEMKVPTNKDIPRMLTYFCIISVIIIILPLCLLDKFWYSQAAETGKFVVLSQQLLKTCNRVIHLQ